jgi:hypothetical protein
MEERERKRNKGRRTKVQASKQPKQRGPQELFTIKTHKQRTVGLVLAISKENFKFTPFLV